MRRIVLIGAMIAGAALFTASPVSLTWSSTQSTVALSQDIAHAAVGKPLSAGSVAGVHRRQERRGNQNTTTHK